MLVAVGVKNDRTLAVGPLKAIGIQFCLLLTDAGIPLGALGFDQRKALGDIAVPTLVLSGSKDKNAPAPMMAKMATYIRASIYVELEGAGHLVNLEQPKAFDAALEQFLNTVKVAA